MPTEQAFHDAFGGEERRYLESEFGIEGVGRVLGGGVITGFGKGDRRVGWRDNWIDGKWRDDVQMINGQSLIVNLLLLT